MIRKTIESILGFPMSDRTFSQAASHAAPWRPWTSSCEYANLAGTKLKRLLRNCGCLLLVYQYLPQKDASIAFDEKMQTSC